MNKKISDLIDRCDFTGDIQIDAFQLLVDKGLKDVAEHSLKVAETAKKIAEKYNCDKEKAFVCGCLHDIGNIIPIIERESFCGEFNIQVLNEEAIAPSLLHPKISRALASLIFNVDDLEILNAIGCHSTLRENAGKLDMILFVADKISWDSNHNMHFIDDIVKGLEVSIECGAFAYLNFLLSDKEKVKVIHPFTLEAYNDLQCRVPTSLKGAPSVAHSEQEAT